MISRQIDAILRESLYGHYLKEFPEIVSAIRTLISHGESADKIKKHVENVVGKSMTSICVGWMIDYVKKQSLN